MAEYKCYSLHLDNWKYNFDDVILVLKLHLYITWPSLKRACNFILSTKFHNLKEYRCIYFMDQKSAIKVSTAFLYVIAQKD